MVGYLWLSYFCVFLFCIKGVKSMGKVAYVTATMPYLMLIILLIYGGTCDGAAAGVAELFVPHYEALEESGTWKRALT